MCSISGGYSVCVIVVATGCKLDNILEEANVRLLPCWTRADRGTAYPVGISRSTRAANQDIAKPPSPPSAPLSRGVLDNSCCSTPQKWNLNDIWWHPNGMKVSVFCLWLSAVHPDDGSNTSSRNVSTFLPFHTHWHIKIQIYFPPRI